MEAPVETLTRIGLIDSGLTVAREVEERANLLDTIENTTWPD
jgi:hypothetical protein